MSNAGLPRWTKNWPMRPTSDVKWPCRRKRWQTRPTSDTGPPRGTKRWLTRLTSNVATSRPNALRLRQQKALAEDEHNEDNDDVARQFEAYAAPLFARIDAVMAKIRAMDDGFGNWAAFGDDILAEEDDKTSAPTMPPSTPPTAVSPTPHRPTTYKDVVLATMGGSLRAKSLVVALLSHPSTTVDD
jgi:hypothetical protein